MAAKGSSERSCIPLILNKKLDMIKLSEKVMLKVETGQVMPFEPNSQVVNPKGRFLK